MNPGSTWVQSAPPYQDFQAHVVVIQLAVAQRDIHVQRQVLAVLQQQALVYIRGLLKVAAQVVDRRQRKLVLRVGPGKSCSPRRRLPLRSTHEGLLRGGYKAAPSLKKPGLTAWRLTTMRRARDM